MLTGSYKASKSSTKGRPGWSISFRHPLRNGSDGKPGLKVRRGLGTTDEAEAERLVVEMNKLLSNDSWWTTDKRREAEERFSQTIVAAFYDDIQAGQADTWELRERTVSLPSKDEGYSRVLFVGTTGEGKTSLLRHIIGSDPDQDRFPSTSTAKTTISDTEVILAEGEYVAVVTFFSEHRIQANLEDCVADACLAAWGKAPDDKIIYELLNHDDQKFRLGYVLGSWGTADPTEDEEEWSFEDEGAQAPDSSDAQDVQSESDHQANRAQLAGYLERIRQISREVSEQVSGQFGQQLDQLTGEDRDAAEDLFEERVSDHQKFARLVHDILDDIRSKFELVDSGELRRRRSGWPELWVFATQDRDEFIRAVRWFSSNHAPYFGRLLTPLVDGIRVRGPLFPAFVNLRPRLVLLDGQGLGHTPESSSSVTTHITRRYQDVDVVLLVDSSQHPMQAGPLAVLRSVASSGHGQKLAMAFTHFDLVRGDNLRSFAEKRSHVLGSVTNAFNSLKDLLGGPVVRTIERQIDERCFMLGALQKPSRKLPQGVVCELERLLIFCKRQIEPEATGVAIPVYDASGLVLAVHAATLDFRQPWMARLGLGSHDGVRKEHWTRIKALNRRIAGELDDEYDSLRPVADLLGRLSEGISRFLDKPVSWRRKPKNAEEAELVLSQIRRQVFSQLHHLATRRVIKGHLKQWRGAWVYRGAGSTFERARDIRHIYEKAAPVPSVTMTEPSVQFLKEVRGIVQGAVEDSGGKFLGSV